MTLASRRHVTATAAALTCILAGSVSRADEATTPEQKAAAQALFEQARSLVDQERFAEACPKLAESERLDPGIGTLLWLADCYENVGQTASAWASFKEAAAAAAQKHDNRERVARERATRVESKLSRLTISVAPGAAIEGLTIHRDGMLVGTAEWGLPLPVDPGAHTVTATAPGRQPWSSTVQVATAAQVDPIMIPLLAAEPSPPVPSESPRERAGADEVNERPTIHRSEEHASVPASTADPHRGNAQRIAGITVAGVGVAAVIVGGVYSLQAKSVYDQANSGSPPHCLPNNECDAIGKSDRSRASSMALVATVAMGAGAAGAIAGAVLFFAAPKPAPAAVALAPTSTGGSVRLTWTW